MSIGKVAKKTDKGYGFIKHSGGETFFHAKDCKTPFDSLVIDDEVQFEFGKDKKGTRCTHVERLED